ncbi:alpha/beta fold hydrolase [Spirosoma oryzicola]|uniref:alpha/beta fold hydrolase n=1 Tax=Spirosoma oryzicola TaxID=2898794 RepID=UPI001E5F348F|nr:alpha/beta hydrolase [Spirosoma oryzicola]UHG89642.1 alpha/beta hydrolase [Spirosoma oryzicola]
MNANGYIDRQGFHLHYSIEGKGRPALVIGSSIYYPRTFVDTIRDQLQLIFVDHRGFVAPPEGELSHDAFTMDTLLEDIEAVRETLQLAHFVIIGHSGHAFLALEYAKKYPQSVAHVVMIGVSPDYSAATHQATAAFFEQEASPDRKAAFAQSMAQLPAKLVRDPQNRFVDYCVCAGPQSWFDYTFDATPLWAGVYTNSQVFDYVWGVVFRDIDITSGLAIFDKPVYVALGKYDFLTGPPSLWDRVSHLFKNLTIKLFEHSSHTPQLEESALFNEDLLAWIGRQPVTY